MNIKLVKRLRENIKYVYFLGIIFLMVKIISTIVIYYYYNQLFVSTENVLTLRKWQLGLTNAGLSNQLFSMNCVK